MSNQWRRYEALLPLKFNDGKEIPPQWIEEATHEIVARFGGASHETQKVEGFWRHAGILYRDDLVRVVVDIQDTPENREWMRSFKARWKSRNQQMDIWLISHPVEIE